MLDFAEVLKVLVGIVFVSDHFSCLAERNSIENSIFLSFSLGYKILVIIFLNCFQGFVELFLGVDRKRRVPVIFIIFTEINFFFI